MSTNSPSSPTLLALAAAAGCALLLSITGCGSSSTAADGGDAAGTTGGAGGGGGKGGTAAGGGVGTGTGGATVTGTGGAVAATDGGGTDAPTGAPPTSALDLCTTFCQRVTKCDTSRDQQTCVNACTNSNSALFPKLRADIVAAIAGCVAVKDCATISTDLSLKTCAGEAAANIGPSPAATAFCTASDTAQAQCGATIDKADCLLSAKIYSDAALTDATACTTKSCSLIYACASATLTQASGAWSLGGGIKPGKKCAGTANPCSFLGSSMAPCQAAGCTFAQTCGGGSPSCFFGNTMAQCMAMTGCTWSGTSCTGVSSIQCNAQTTPTACQQFVGCFASGTCSGTVPLCTTLGVTACPAHPGCTVQDAL